MKWGRGLPTPWATGSAEGALFYIDCTDQQLTVFPDGLTTGRIMTNAGKTRSWGLELSGHAKPATPLDLTMSYGFTDARFRKFDNGKESYSGNHVPYSPMHTLFVSAAWSMDLRSAFATGCVWRRISRARARYGGTRQIRSPSPFMAFSAPPVTFGHERWSMQLWGRNITDTGYSTFYFVSISHQFLQRGMPATWGATLRINDMEKQMYQITQYKT